MRVLGCNKLTTYSDRTLTVQMEKINIENNELIHAKFCEFLQQFITWFERYASSCLWHCRMLITFWYRLIKQFHHHWNKTLCGCNLFFKILHKTCVDFHLHLVWFFVYLFLLLWCLYSCICCSFFFYFWILLLGYTYTVQNHICESVLTTVSETKQLPFFRSWSPFFETEVKKVFGKISPKIVALFTFAAYIIIFNVLVHI